MAELEFEGTLILESLAKIGEVDAFLEAVDCDDFAEAKRLMKRAGVEPSEIEIVLAKMRAGED